MQERTSRQLMLLCLIVVGAAVFLPALTGGWIYDDHPLIEENPYIHSFHWFSRWFTTDFWDVNEEILRYQSRMVYWRPLVTLTYAVDWQLGHGSPLVFHVMNTLYQALVAALAFFALRRWIGATWPAFLAALVFAVHPTKAESVAWVAGRTDVLCMVFVLVASAGIARRYRGARGGIVLEVVGTLGAYLCKEQAIVLPVFAALEAWVALGRPPIDRAVVRPLIKAAWPQALIAVGYLAVRAAVLPIAAAITGKPLGLLHHGLAILETFGRFFALTFAPHDLSIQHALVHSSSGVAIHSMPYVAVGAVGLVVLVALAVVARRRWPIATVGIAFYLVTLLPTSNLKYTEMATLVSERFLYLPVLGIALVLGAAVARATGPWRTRATALAITATLGLGMLSLSRSADYRDEASFWEREANLHPDSREARLFALRTAVQERHFQTGLHILLELKEIQDRYDRTANVHAMFGYQVARLTQHLVPDKDIKTLTALDDFCADLIAHEKPVAELTVAGIRLSIPMTVSGFAENTNKLASQLFALRAVFNSRLGRDERALMYASQARLHCQYCISVVMADALTYARAGRYPEAIDIVDSATGHVDEKALEELRAMIVKARELHDAMLRSTGPAQLQAHAKELATLELYGRAYDVLAPHKLEIMQAPSVAPGFAELAFRAGDTAVAREVLATFTSEVDPQLHEWALTMGWVEQ